jgi:aspartate aminotransferase
MEAGMGARARDLVSSDVFLPESLDLQRLSISQEAARAAITDIERSEASVAGMLSHYDRRRRMFLEGLRAVPGIDCVDPEGAFYLFPKMSGLYPKKKVKGSVEFCRLLLEEARVAAVPGEAFGMDACVRFSFATPEERIREGISRITEWVGKRFVICDL